MWSYIHVSTERLSIKIQDVELAVGFHLYLHWIICFYSADEFSMDDHVHMNGNAGQSISRTEITVQAFEKLRRDLDRAQMVIYFNWKYTIQYYSGKITFWIWFLQIFEAWPDYYQWQHQFCFYFNFWWNVTTSLSLHFILQY